VTTNKVENFFGQLKQSIDGMFHHVSYEHLHCYLYEFDFRYSTRNSTNSGRVRRLMCQASGRRLSYRPLTGGRSVVICDSNKLPLTWRFARPAGITGSPRYRHAALRSIV